jgi:polyketide cyclase/dehydrase/lipid transport protein
VQLVTQKDIHFAYPRAVVWATMADVDSFRMWWPWLRTFEARGLITGDQWRCTVRPPLPYTVSFTIALEDILEEERVLARVHGDIAGTAELTLFSVDDGCRVVVRSDLAPQSRFLRVMAATVPPMARFGHDWILVTGAAQFKARALPATAGAPDTTT